MRNFGVLKAVILLQAVCMIALSAVVIVKLSPFGSEPEGRDPESGGKAALNDGAEGNGDSMEESSAIAATVGGEPILVSELEQQLYKQYGDTVLRTMMARKAIDLEAKAQQLSVTAEEQERELTVAMEGYESEEAYYRVMLEQLGMNKDDLLEEMRYKLLIEKIAMMTVQVTDEDVERYIDEHADQFADQLQFRLQWIVTATEREANDVLAMLADGENFALIAKTYSIDEFTSESGGDLGLIDSDDPFYDAELLDTAGQLQTGEMAGPLEVEEGFAVIQVTERRKTEGLSGRKLQETARKQLALSRALPLQDIEDELLLKYDAGKRK
ncbi:peptidyl-prolyl cis-trans isomerase [Paenibacillus sp. NEAU-GSW1]|uniref:peptidyl-prolyl cis-trans isomerase n=1 Tax=Paenibacillus sp. NEAU-GSW1 TaxID=2682486 RepID=UPI0012E1E0F7|nr:peptidyl-prolyl cis-trans isomerase [Paenibacillus sp. NEAU-GSW1]MUT67669.1 hypothetical protein [Paenibacillus sp. NEAU-GSW1]